jgi:DNA-binding transcriptional ArsR family regulator
VHAFDVLGDPVRRRILELIAKDELAAGDVAEAVAAEFGITQSAVSQHLKVLREHGFAHMRPDGPRRLYSLDTTGIEHITRWMDSLRRDWDRRLDALETEIGRGKRAKRRSATAG